MRRAWWVVGLALALLIVAFLAPLASPEPDGLERVAIDHGFLDEAQGPPFAIFPDYTVPGVTDGTATTIAAGIIGTALVFALVWVLGSLLARKRQGDRAKPT
jgi:cobalt/nickel transport protein